MFTSPAQVGVNPYAVIHSAASGSSSYEKVIDLLVRDSHLHSSCLALSEMQRLPYLLKSDLVPEALMDEQVYALFKSTRVLLEPFRELCIHLVPWTSELQ